MTPEGLRQAALARSTYYFDFPGDVVAYPFDSFDDLGPYDRCISRGVVEGMLPTLYSMGTEIMQAPGYIVIRNEMILRRGKRGMGEGVEAPVRRSQRTAA